MAPGAPAVNPGSDAAPASPLNKFLIGVIVAMSLVAVLLVVFAIYRIAFHAKSQSPAAVELPLPAPDVTLPARSVIQSLQVSGDRLIVQLRTERGDEIDILDLKNGHLVARVVTATPPAPPVPQ